MEECDNSWDSGDISTMPDYVLEARLWSEANQRDYLWELYSTVAAYALSSGEILLDSIRILYGDAISGRVRVLLSREMACESTLNELGLCLRLNAESPWTPLGRIDLLSALNIDLQEIIEERDYDSVRCGLSVNSTHLLGN
jgi:hypothetical protein